MEGKPPVTDSEYKRIAIEFLLESIVQLIIFFLSGITKDWFIWLWDRRWYCYSEDFSSLIGFFKQKQNNTSLGTTMWIIYHGITVLLWIKIGEFEFIFTLNQHSILKNFASLTNFRFMQIFFNYRLCAPKYENVLIKKRSQLLKMYI